MKTEAKHGATAPARPPIGRIIPLETATAAMVRHMEETDVFLVDNETYLLIKAASPLMDFLAAFGAEGEDLEEGGDAEAEDDPSEDGDVSEDGDPLEDNHDRELDLRNTPKVAPGLQDQVPVGYPVRDKDGRWRYSGRLVKQVPSRYRKDTGDAS